MKKIINFLLIIISICSFSILFNSEKIQEKNNIEKAERKFDNSYNILIPSDIQKNKEEQNVYDYIIEVIKKHNANIYYSKIGDDDKKIKFIYLSELSYFNNFEIAQGRSLNLDEMESDKFLSTEETGDKNQIGKISVFDGKQLFEIRTLKSIINSNYMLDGNCTVQLQNGDNIDEFIDDLEESLQVKGIQRQTEDNIEDKYYYNQWVIPVLYFIILLLILYRILKSYKKFGVQKMLGYSIKDIWLKEELNLIISQCIIIFIANIIMSIFCFSEFNIFFIRFIMKLLIMNIIQIVILFVVTSIPFIYLRNVTVQNVIKNKLPIKDIIIFNSVLKVLLIVLFFNLINQGIQNYDRINYVFSNKYKAWENANDYYIIPYLSSKQGEPPLDESDRATQLYFNLNKDGTIMADFNLFLPDQRETLKNDKQYDYERDWVTVNPNYLKENIIYDVNNEPVNISEEDTNLVLLVPDKYKKDEKGIIELWEKIKSGYLEDFIRHQNIKIIYTKSNQEIFSYQAAVNIDNGNMVKDPIVRVITEKNGVPFDYHITIGFTGYPIKIKVDPSFDAEKYIYNKLKEVGLEKYVDKIAPANDGVAFESKSVYELIIFIAGGIIMLMIAMIIVITQNIYCFFEQYKKQLAIRQFHGYRAIDKYKECYILIGITSLGAFIINACVGKMNINIQIILTFVFILIDLFMTTITIRCVGKRKIISVIKGS